MLEFQGHVELFFLDVAEPSGKTGLAIKVTAKTGATDSEEFEASPLAASLEPVSGPIATTIDVSIDVGGGTLSQSVTLPLTGTGTEKSVSKGGDDFDLDSVKLTSKIH